MLRYDALQDAISRWRESTDPADASAPVGLMLSSYDAGGIAIVTGLDGLRVIAEWTLGQAWIDTTGCDRFARLDGEGPSAVLMRALNPR
jgi:hypothetical protein